MIKSNRHIKRSTSPHLANKTHKKDKKPHKKSFLHIKKYFFLSFLTKI